MTYDAGESYKRELWRDIDFYSAIIAINLLHDPVLAVIDASYPQVFGLGQIVLLVIAGWRLVEKIIDRYHMK